ncbi:hypothetical protein ACFQX6_46795 [Streptosporangium lutulentum]
MLAVFASTGGLTGIEVGIAGGTSMLSQKLLEAVFGDQAVRTLTVKARVDLRARVAALLGEEAARFTVLLDAVEPPEGAATALRATARAIQDHLRELPVGERQEALPEGERQGGLPGGGRQGELPEGERGRVPPALPRPADDPQAVQERGRTSGAAPRTTGGETGEA